MNAVNFKDKTCQEASILSYEKYIPCGQPALALVWHNGDAKAYFMCVGCADHNVRNRGVVLLATTDESLRREYLEENRGDICGLCGQPGADKMPHPAHWPGERIPDSELVHAECEKAECQRAHAALTKDQRDAFLRSIGRR